ncbi:MAG: PepSY domain-containing protein [Deltaproteobacteria bacterium]|nr:PepSY domain-containing protein [Deltaproteobacteria bacterium]
MKKTFIIILMMVFSIICFTGRSAVANTEGGSVSILDAVETALNAVPGKLVDVERELNAIEVQVATKKYGVVEVYIDDKTGEILMMENAETEFGGKKDH